MSIESNNLPFRPCKITPEESSEQRNGRLLLAKFALPLMKAEKVLTGYQSGGSGYLSDGSRDLLVRLCARSRRKGISETKGFEDILKKKGMLLLCAKCKHYSLRR